MCTLNIYIPAMTSEYWNLFCTDYEAIFEPYIHLVLDGLHVNSAESLVLKESIESTHMTIKYGTMPVMSDDATVLYTDIVKCSTPWDTLCCRSY
jgi:hypothetical protein